MNKKTKEIKTFYQDDKLNKGYAVETKPQEPEVKEVLGKRSGFLLPAAEVLSEYEAISPGALDKILKMAEKEQEKKFHIEKIAIQSNERSKRLGSLLGVLTIGIIATASYELASIDLTSAIIFIIASFLSVFGLSLFLTCKKDPNSQFSKPGNFNQHNNNRDGGKRFFRNKNRNRK